MAQEQVTQKETKTTEKCTCNKRLLALEKEVADLKAQIAVLRRVLQGGK